MNNVINVMANWYFLAIVSVILVPLCVVLIYKRNVRNFQGWIVAILWLLAMTSVFLIDKKESDYIVVDYNNKEFEIRGQCKEETMTCKIEDKTIKVISFEKTEKRSK